MMPELDGVHMEVVRWLTGMSPRKVKGKWVYQHSADVLAEAYLLTTHRVLHPETSPHRTQHYPGLRRSEGVQGGGGGKALQCAGRTWLSRFDGSVERGGRGVTTLPPAVSHVRVASHVRPTIAEAERPRERMPQVDAGDG